MIQVLEEKHHHHVVGGISVPNPGNRAPSGSMSMSSMGNAISFISMAAGLTPAGAMGRTAIFAAGVIGMAMSSAGSDS
ncbi:hypothetical protein [Pseudohongiella acticola]|jgi:hypothetical protein|uniref:hypothetical protein n=1 Tax=Pseudohongiella acticola TaxID=1524254 RepID=UPI0030EC78B4